MAETLREVKETTVRDNDDLVDDRREPTASNTTVVARVIGLIGGVIMAILGMRFVLSLMGANRGNTFADFIYSVSHPFVAPFFGLFNYQEQFGVVRFEFETLIAIAFWGFVTWLIIQMATIATRDR